MTELEFVENIESILTAFETGQNDKPRTVITLIDFLMSQFESDAKGFKDNCRTVEQNYLLDNASKCLDNLLMLLTRIKKMRDLQERYFKFRDKNALNDARHAEGQVDMALRKLMAEGYQVQGLKQTAEQKSLF